ncbi:MAG: amidohydrolase [Rhodothermales bacterium]|nr:amidohydrolase [Rhodothermales bacterium]
MPSTESVNGIELSTDFTSVREDLSQLLSTVRRHLHKNPEIGGEEYETYRFIRELLEMHGLDVTGPLAGTGLYVDIEGAHTGPTVGYRADIDALPIRDEKNVEYCSSVEDRGHLCGHDAHTSIAVGVALLLHGLRDMIHGTVRVFFQPNEEGIPSGAPQMIRDGVLDGVSAVYASHVDPTLDTGRFGLVTGAITASGDQFRVRVEGPATGHSARPHQTRDTIWIATQIMNSLYQIVGRITDARNAAVISICRIHAGEAYNVIPQMTEFGGTYRCTEVQDRELIKDKIGRLACDIGEAYGATVDVKFEEGAPPVINNGELVGVLRETLVEALGEQAIFDIPRPSMGAEDFAHYLNHVPGMLIRVGTCNGPETAYPLHDSKFDIDESAMPLASRVVAQTLIRYLRHHSGERSGGNRQDH